MTPLDLQKESNVVVKRDQQQRPRCMENDLQKRRIHVYSLLSQQLQLQRVLQRQEGLENILAELRCDTHIM